jgi:uncharacterized membrane protein YozB (DUF420 family)
MKHTPAARSPLGGLCRRSPPTYHEEVAPAGKDGFVQSVFSGPHVILGLKVAVAAVTVLLLASLVALVSGRVRLHGRINLAFAALTGAALVAFEVVIRVLNPHAFDYFSPQDSQALSVHLCFSVPSALLIPVMLYTGLSRRRTVHLALAVVFGLLWVGTFVTGVFFLPHTPGP